MNTRGGIELPHTTGNGRARATALQGLWHDSTESVSSVSYHSDGSLLIIGSTTDHALAAAEQLKSVMSCTILLPPGPDEGNTHEIARKIPAGLKVVTHRLTELKGFLGHFVALVTTEQGDANLARILSNERDDFDLVLDLTVSPMIRSEVLPPGYYAPRADAQALAGALTEIPSMLGDFEKPKFFNYNPSICAHGDSGLEGCSNCLVACPTSAITSLGESIEVNPHLCQGAGSCATVCPTGAITYGYPKASILLSEIRGVLQSYRDNQGRQACVLFYDREWGATVVKRIGADIAEYVIPFEVEELGSVGPEVWLSALAFGASHVALLVTENLPPTVIRHLEAQIGIASALLEGMEHDPRRLHLLRAHEPLVDTLNALQNQPEFSPATFSSPDEKRTTLRMAIDHLYRQNGERAVSVMLPEGAPFGEVEVDRDACTLCMSCVTVCPASALLDGKDTPKLSFIEWNCVQCGLCEVACPEHAIRRHPRFLYRQDERMRPRILNEETPFCCVVCGKPFATHSMMATMREKLKDHWMFQDEQSLRRLQMCENCRVKDLFAAGEEMNVHNKPPMN